MAAPYTHGNVTKILMDSANPPTTDISVDITTSNMGRKRKVHEWEAYGMGAVGRAGGNRDLGPFTFTMRTNATNHAAMYALSLLDTVYVIVRPFGTGSGLKQYLFSGFFEEFPMEAPGDDILEREYSIAVNGDWTESSQ